ncbi:Three-deoxy-D-manno-octulosonic-acid transferase domain-containing protein [Thermodesulfobacterium geofontis OPF15]|jgi:3-deoxy-D-manno-octulosonic-acid transferase|uniref:3-deoxy-D-manno-octulosonic acid transferase n=1 Tax=Thermodesulfobacterium geofontis (strain OPF15) TaxID=795359 RepID=F8C681_THEGP|nr:3-deoxy-D-manno-octulosonic acid transferase [Thermodesulfobacterium geofontis]AEH23235.1 Three-deoxy-D-manno-octulosonic-acid transferase domain-containing protein [Thermodesulfobacterium geofontis OPF15]
MIFQLYTFLYYLVNGFFLPKEFFKRPSQLRKKWLKDKLALFTKTDFISQRKVVWIHAVSVGEVIAISSLIKSLAKEYDILLSTITDTGNQVASQRFKDLPVKIIYLPLDCPFAIKRTLRTFNPSALLIAETEIWPNLILISSKKIPVFLINARISDKSFRRYKKIKFFLKPILSSFSLIAVQDEKYKNRFKDLGAPEDKIVVTGNTKFDIEIPYISFLWENLVPRPIIVAGSTHFPEEKLITETFLKIPIPSSLFIVPRHPERYKEVERIINSMIDEKNEIGFYKLSELPLDMRSYFKIIILVDRMGILGSLYRIADIAIIGGSFIPHGGQNPLEAIYWKKPVIFGPSMENFPFIEEFLERGACLQTEKEELKDLLEDLLKNPDKRIELGEKAYQILKQKTGATEKILNLLKSYLK